MRDPESPDDLTVDDAVEVAVVFQQHGRFEEADRVYKDVLAVDPDHPDALHFAGILAHQQGRSDEGVALIERSLAVAPGRADCYSNLGIIHKARGRVDEALEAYRQALALDPNHPNSYNNLGVLLKAREQFDEAEAAYRKAIGLDEKHVEAWHNLGVLLGSRRRTREAVECYCRVTTLQPRHESARTLLALAHCTLGEVDKAVEIFEQWLAEEPHHPVPAHMLAACTGKDVPARASDHYVEVVFDAFAASFESKLKALAYRAPEIVGALLADAGLQAAGGADILDAGCGTGLCGLHLAPYARRLVGVDLSGGMLVAAREKGVYHELYKAELTQYLREHPAEFDVIVSADTLVYFGSLEEVVAAAAASVRPGGLLAFTAETWATDDPEATHRIATHGRYMHAPAYVERVLTAHAFTPVIVDVELRMESGLPVKGMAVRARRAA